MENFTLKGTLSEQANQLFNIIRERQLSPEQLDKIIPVSKDFISTFAAVLKEQMSNDTANYQSVVKTFASVMETLASKYNENSPSEVRHELLECISDLSRELSSMEKYRDDNSTIFRSIVSVIFGIFAVVLLVVSAGKIQIDPKNYKA